MYQCRRETGDERGEAMDWKTLFLSADGRIGRRDFWIGAGLLFAANLVLGLVPAIGQLVHLASIYVWVCLASKRLHDFGRSGWLNIAPYAVWALALVVILVTSGAAILTAIVSGGEGAAAAAMLGALGIGSLAAGGAFLFGLLFLLWVGLTPSSPGENRYGGTPGPLIAAAPPPT
jgi:uncharacterized membrane protein YhaH (DUF805 family)